MAEKKFSQLTAKGATIADTDLVAISESAGGGSYTSKSVTGANIKALVTDANLTTTDVTTNDVSTTKHGFAPKSPNDGTKFLDGLGAYDTVKDSDLSLSDVTDNNVSTTKHGFVPKAPNDTAKFLRGDGTWDTPAGGGLTNFTEAESTSSPNNTVYVDSLSAAGSTTNVDVAIVPKGTGAFMLDIPDGTSAGGNKRGVNAVDLQMVRTGATQVASGTYSFSAGSNNTSNGTYSVTLGVQNTASNNADTSFGYLNSSTGSYSITGGESNIASSSYAVAMGQSNTSSGQASTSFGYANVANGGYSFVGGRGAHIFGITGRNTYGYLNAALGDCQSSKFYLSVRTTNATTTTLTVAGGAASTNNQVILSNQSGYRFKGTIIGKKSGTTDVAAWDIDGLIVRGANAAATTLVVSNVNVVDNTPAWGTPALTADTTNGGLKVEVTGASSTNIQWTAVIETTEVIYA